MFEELTSEQFADAITDICSPWQALMPPKRLRVSEGAARSLVIKQPGGAAGNWNLDETPYMEEPMDMLASRRHEGVVFAGPARTGKTMGLLDGWVTHTVVNDPGDFLIVQMSQEKAREFSRTRIDRALRNSPDLKALMGSSAQDDNTHDKAFKHGMWLRIGWPTVSQLSSSDYRYVALTDYDRMPDDVGGEGSAWGLGLKRTTTFLSRGMCMAESSPGHDMQDANWKPVTPHEAPPVSGVLGIYNRSDRRRWYWKCMDCSEWFEAAPGLGLFKLPAESELVDIVREIDIPSMAKQWAKVVCPHCGSLHEFRQRHLLNKRGRWLQDGLALTSDDEVVGTALTSSIAGYWMGGVAATYQKWSSLVERYLQGLREYALSGSELSLKNTVNLDQGMPYISRHLVEGLGRSQNPEDRPDKGLQRYVVPEWTRFVVASVDVQGGSNAHFSVQVHAVGPNFEQALVNRFKITESRREGMGSEFAPIDPSSYEEDWDLITDQVVRATFKTPSDDREIRVKMTVVDSGGEDGVTDKAYAWMRKMRKAGFGVRVMLYKGASSKTAPMIRESIVGGRNTKEKGDVPIYSCNPNMLADAVSTGLKRSAPGPGYYHFPEPKGPKNPNGWLPRSFFDELQAEVRDPNGTWRQIKKRNESFDHCKMIYAACLRLGADKIKNWDNAPTWAQPLATNSEIVTSEQRREMRADIPAVSVEPARRVRRTAASPYLG